MDAIVRIEPIDPENGVFGPSGASGEFRLDNSGLVTIPLVLEPAALPGARVGVAYDVALRATNAIGRTTIALDAGSLPLGLAFDPARKRVSGIPRQPSIASFRVQACDEATPPRASRVTFALAVEEAPETLRRLVVNEISSGERDWLEIANLDPAEARALGGFHLKLYSGAGDLIVDFSCPGAVVPAGGFLTLVEESSAGPGELALGAELPLTPVTPFQVALVSPSGEIADYVAVGVVTPIDGVPSTIKDTVPAGSPIVYRPARSATGDLALDFAAASGPGTPGAANPGQGPVPFSIDEPPPLQGYDGFTFRCDLRARGGLPPCGV